MNPITARPTSQETAQGQAVARHPALNYLAWILPALATAALGLFELGGPQLWRDELATWSAASRSIPQLWAMLHNIDAVLGVYYFGMHLWMSLFGDSAVAMRLPSVVAMTAAAAVVGLIGRRLGGGMAGVASGLVFALIPSVSRYAQEARPYAFATLFAALATLMFLRAMERPSWGRWAIYTLVLAATGAANLVAITVAAGHLLIIGWDFLQRTVRLGGEGTPETGRMLPGGRLAPAGAPLMLVKRFCVAVAAAVVLLSPLLYEGHRQQYWQIGYQPKPHVAELIGVSGGLWQQLFASVPVAALVLLLAVASFTAAPDARRRAIAGYAMALAIAPVVAVWLISRGPTSYWTFRYILFSIAGWSVGAGLCVAFLADRARGTRIARWTGRLSPRFAVAVLIIVVVGAAGVHNQLAIRQKDAHNLWAYPDLPPNGTAVDYQAAARVIAANQRPGDGIVYQVMDDNHYQVDTSIAYYLGDKRPKAVFQSQTQVQTNSLLPTQCADPAACHLVGTPRIWVVYVSHLAPDPFSAMADPTVTSLPANPMLSARATYLLSLGYQVTRTWNETGVSVALLTVP